MGLRPFLAPRFDLAAHRSEKPVELPRGHIPALDAIRGLAIIAVTLYRFGGGGEGPARAVSHSWLIDLGAHGVDLFFVLSGFLITGILFDAKGTEHYFRNFYVRRALRIFPLYYAALVALLIVLPRWGPSLSAAFQPAVEQQAWLWLYGANIFQSASGQWSLGPLNHFWSLAIEEHFYLLWPAVIYFTSRVTAMRACCVLFFASIFARATWLAMGGNDVAAEVLTPLRMDGLVLGSWLALAARTPGGLTPLNCWAGPALVLCGVAALAAEMLGRRLFGFPCAAWAGTCGAFLILLVAAPRTHWSGRFGNSRILQFFGKYSYAMYVLQLPLIYLVVPLITAPGLADLLGSQLVGQLAYCAILSSLTVACAWLSWNLFEKHCLKLKSQFS